MHLANPIFHDHDDQYVCKVARNAQEAMQLIELGFEYVTGEYHDGGNCLRSKSCYTSAPKAEKACSPDKRARSLGWIRTLACGAVVLWFRR